MEPLVREVFVKENRSTMSLRLFVMHLLRDTNFTSEHFSWTRFPPENDFFDWFIAKRVKDHFDIFRFYVVFWKAGNFFLYVLFSTFPKSHWDLWEDIEDLFLKLNLSSISSVIRQKGESQNGCFKKKHAKFCKKTNISCPLIRRYICAYQGVRNVRFSENLTCFIFLKHPFWNLLFCLFTNALNLNHLNLFHADERL